MRKTWCRKCKYWKHQKNSGWYCEVDGNKQWNEDCEKYKHQFWWIKKIGFLTKKSK